jgi:serine/threonine protein kinase
MDALIQELIIMWRLRDKPNIARFYGFGENPATVILHYYTHGTLSDYIQFTIQGALPIAQVETMARGLASAISAVHELGFAHCDIKVSAHTGKIINKQPANILLEEDETGKYYPILTDFGISKMLPNRSRSVQAFKPITLMAASLAYAPPEILSALRGQPNAIDYCMQLDVLPKCDIYSFSMVVYEMLAGERPWDGLDTRIVYNNVMNDLRPNLPATEDERASRLSSIVKKCWRENPLHRPAALELVDLLK